MIAILRLVLAAVFLVAGVAKLLDRDGSRRAMRGFGVPERLVVPLALLLPVAELTLAAGLVPAATGPFAAAGAAALLALFALAIVIALARGRTPECHCFGRLHSAPAGWGTLARNAALVALAVVIAWQPASDPSRFELAVAGVVLVIAAQALLSFTLLRRYGRALRRLEELEARPARHALAVGAEAPSFAFAGRDGTRTTLDGLLIRAKPVLLVFSSSGCGPCQALLPKVAGWQERLADHVTVALLEDEPIVADWYGVEATPSAVLVGVDGTVAHALVSGGREIERLVRTLTSDIKPGEAARNGRARVATATALAGGLAVTAVAQAASNPASALDPELQAIDAAFKAGLQRLAAASDRSAKAVHAYATTRPNAKLMRTRRTAAIRALSAERREVIALRARIKALPASGDPAGLVKQRLLAGLSLMAGSLKHHERALPATPEKAASLLSTSQRLRVDSVVPIATAAAVMRSQR